MITRDSLVLYLFLTVILANRVKKNSAFKLRWWPVHDPIVVKILFVL